MTSVKRVDRQTLVDDRKSFKANPPQDFLNLDKSARSAKLSKRQVIEDYWECHIQDCIPQSCAPRVMSGKNRHAKAGDDNALLPWYHWSVSLINELAKLAMLAKLSHALELVQIERSKRHNDSSNQYREAVQILTGDVKAAIAAHKEENKVRTANKAAGIGNAALSKDQEMSTETAGKFILSQGMLKYMGAGSTQSRNLIWSTLDEYSQRRITSMRQASVRRISGLRVQAGQLRFDAAEMKLEGEALAEVEAAAAALDARREKLNVQHYAQFGD